MYSNHDKKLLFDRLKEMGAFWSGCSENPGCFSREDDREMMEKALLYLDFDDMHYLFNAYPADKVKSFWRKEIVPQGQRYNIANWLIGVMVFNIKNINSYLNRCQLLPAKARSMEMPPARTVG